MMCFVSPLPIVVAGMVFIVRETTPFPVEQIDRNPYYDPLENQYVEMPRNTMLVEGDVKISLVDMLQDMRPFHSSEPTNSRYRNSVSAPDLLWNYGLVPYALDPALNETEVKTILGAMSYITNVTGECVKFNPRAPNDNDFVFITSSTSGCYSEVGRQGRGNQTVSVSRASDCVTLGIVMHELLHVLGFWHEHTRPDRDQYIKLLHQNIRFDHKTDFSINTNSKNQVNVYDYYSILHYKTNQFSYADNLKTIQILDRTVDERIVGQRFNLSSLDILRIKRLYVCEELTLTQMQPKPEIPQRDIEYNEISPNTTPSALRRQLVEETQSALTRRVLSTTLLARTGTKTTIKQAAFSGTELPNELLPSTRTLPSQLNIDDEEDVHY
ncbi:astacin-like isoform X2 [Dreissena polymorpha]|uniref:Metalloendopeptidase n=2 Tax=Dreissena polymorpha TaxID=45954 RepID=A0A9D4M978_DREPO|nr:astacin-like isoform X2 [Dreissena polymorpha]XP_052266223.1 astacin-like isoform X2 [Dreissena polymorpha]KAH3871317.1 hypothetical protein DPMN_034514 [Dreissena polymorpha]